jgi:putative transposase
VQYLKGRSSHKLLAEFTGLRKRYWGKQLWARSNWVANGGNVTHEVWMNVSDVRRLNRQGVGGESPLR